MTKITTATMTSSAYPAPLPRLSVRDSFDEDDPSDVDDEVFIRDGRNGGPRINEDRSAEKPLMAPRRKSKNGKIDGDPKLPYGALLPPFCYGTLALLVPLALVVAWVYVVDLYPVPLDVPRKWLYGSDDVRNIAERSNIAPCVSLDSSSLWTRMLTKFAPEAPFESVDANGDGINDVVVGFGSGLDAPDASAGPRQSYYGGRKLFSGGITALDGNTGSTLWIHRTSRAIFGVNCELDITGDGIKDCLANGMGGIFHAVDGSNGTLVWRIIDPRSHFREAWESNAVEIYDATYMSDIDEDDVGDVVATHTVRSGDAIESEIVLISGKTGTILRRVNFPWKEELPIAPRPLLRSDGETTLVLVSSTPKKFGGLYAISRSELMHGRSHFRELYRGAGAGILPPPILIDLTLDGTEDIVVATLNGTVIAFDGRSSRKIWEYTVPNSEVTSVPISGYYNDDEVPDLMVKHRLVSGYPLHPRAVSTILDGRSGVSILEKSMIDSEERGRTSGLSISVEGHGNDWFLHWSSDCSNFREEYRSRRGRSSFQADLAESRCNESLATRLWALSQRVGPPGQSIYRSEKILEYNDSADSRLEVDEYLVGGEISALGSERTPRLERIDRKEAANMRRRYEDYPTEGVDESANFYYYYDEKGVAGPGETENGDGDVRERRSDSVDTTARTNGGGDFMEVSSRYDDRKEASVAEGKGVKLAAKSRRGKRRRRRLENREESEALLWGMQRQLPAGILLPSIAPVDGKISVDLVFFTHRPPISRASLALRQRDSTGRENSFGRLALGPTTIHRLRLSCACPDDALPGQGCRNISERQNWSMRTGNPANGLFRASNEQRSP